MICYTGGLCCCVCVYVMNANAGEVYFGSSGG